MAAKRKSAPTRSTGIESLFHRVVAILDQARESVVRSVNSHMVLAYWHIGREIVQTLQAGDERAEYGRRLVADLSDRLTGRFGRGFSTTNLWYFRQFYLAYADRRPEILHKPGGESTPAGKLHKAASFSAPRRTRPWRNTPCSLRAGKSSPPGTSSISRRKWSCAASSHASAACSSPGGPQSVNGRNRPMRPGHRAALKEIRTFPSLVRYPRDAMGRPIAGSSPSSRCAAS